MAQDPGLPGAPQPPEQAAPPQGNPAEIVKATHEGMLALQQLVASDPQIQEPLKAELAGLIQGFEGLVEKLSGGGAPPEAPQGPPAQNPVPVNAGPGSVPVV